jgi:PAS domain S-box-containing protein
VTRDIPVILLSARAGEESRVEGLNAGADDYLVKPFAARELIARVGGMLALARLRRQADQELRASESRFRALLDEAPLGVYLVDGDFRIAAINPTALAVFGDIPGLVGRDFDEVIHLVWPRPHADGVVAQFRRTLETGQSYVVDEHTDVRRDRGVREFYEWQVNRIPLLDGTYGVVCYFRDISSQVLARRDAETARGEAEAANKAKSEFLAAMSHELRTPLNAIGGHVQLLEMELYGPITDAQRVALARVRRSEHHLLSLITDVLNFAKLEAGRVEYQIGPVPLAAVVADVASMIGPQLVAKSLSYDVRVDSGVVAWADQEKVQQIVINLLSNAIKFTEPGGRITVETPAGTPGAVAILHVVDTGPGIPPDKQSMIFEPFVQLHRDVARAEGTGLGLAISRDLARGMGGDLEVRSVEGGGSTFVLSLPGHLR